MEIITFSNGTGNNVQEAVIVHGGATLSDIINAELDYLQAKLSIKETHIKSIDVYFFSVGGYHYNKFMLETKYGVSAPVIFNINLSAADIDKDAADFIREFHPYLIH